MSFLFRLLPRRVALAVGAGLGWLWYRLIPIRRAVALENLAIAFPDLQQRERRRIARASYLELGRSLAETLRLGGLERAALSGFIERQGLDHLEAALAAGRGVIAVCAHFGSFDLLACAEALAGVPVHVVTREQRLRGVNRLWMEVRARAGVGLISARGSALAIDRLLRNNQVVAFVIDQHMPPGRGIGVPFFGRPVSTIHAPAVFALKTGAALLPVTIERLAEGRQRVRYDPPLAPSQTGDRSLDIHAITAALNRWLEGRIRERPDHWLWIHRRFKPLHS